MILGISALLKNFTHWNGNRRGAEDAEKCGGRFLGGVHGV